MSAFDYKSLGQVAPAAATPTDLYTVPGGKQAIISSLLIANQNTTGIKYRVSIRPAGAAQADQHYVAFDTYLPGNSTDEVKVLTLTATDVITVYTDTTAVSFNASGTEVTP